MFLPSHWPTFLILISHQPVEAGAGAGQGEELPGDCRVGDGHDQGGQDQDYGQHVQLETLPVGLQCDNEDLSSLDVHMYVQNVHT